MSFKVHDGSFGKGMGFLSSGTFHLPKRAGWGVEPVGAARVADVELATEANVKKLSGTLGWGAVGSIALGPVGLLAGLLMGGKKTEVTFVVTFVDGRAFIATGDHKVWVAIRAAVLEPISRNKAAASRVATEAARPPTPIEPEHPSLTGDPLVFISWAFEAGGWDFEKLPKKGYERHTVFHATRGRREVVLAQTADAVTDHSLSQMDDTMTAISSSAEKIVVSPSIGARVERVAKMMNINVAGLSDLKVALVR